MKSLGHQQRRHTISAQASITISADVHERLQRNPEWTAIWQRIWQRMIARRAEQSNTDRLAS